MRRLRRFLADDKGSTAVEFALVSVAFLSTIFGIFEVGRVYWTYNTMQYAVEQTARYYLVNTSSTNSQLTTYAQGQMGSNINTGPLTISVAKTTTAGVNQVTITGTYTYAAIVPLLPSSWTSLTLTSVTQLPTP
jgi:Flp pilus assembly protein TadG